MIIVERATEEDILAMCEMDARVIGDRSRCEFISRAVTNRQALIAREGFTRVGFAVRTQNFFERHFVELLLVHPDHRRKGAATALIHYAEKTCPDDRIFTSTNESNTIMQELCDKLGYERSGYIDNLDPGDPELIYVKFLER